VRLLMTCAHPDYMHFFELCSPFAMSVHIILAFDLCT